MLTIYIEYFNAVVHYFRLKLAKADATLKAYDARFLCYGPVLPTSLDSPPELLVAVSGEKVLGKHNEEDAPSFMLSAAHQSHAVCC